MFEVLVTLLIVVLAAGIMYWAISLVPAPQPFKQIAMAVMALILLIWLLGLLFGWTSTPSFRG